MVANASVAGKDGCIWDQGFLGKTQGLTASIRMPRPSLEPDTILSYWYALTIRQPKKAPAIARGTSASAFHQDSLEQMIGYIRDSWSLLELWESSSHRKV